MTNNCIHCKRQQQLDTSEIAERLRELGTAIQTTEPSKDMLIEQLKRERDHAVDASKRARKDLYRIASERRFQAAVATLQGYIAAGETAEHALIARWSVKYADALLKELDKKEDGE